MAVTVKWYHNAILKALNKEINWTEASKIKVALLGSAFTPAQQTQDYWNDCSANEITGTGYTAGGATMASCTAAVSAGKVVLDAADVTWASSTITAHYAVIYYNTGTATTSPLIAYIDFGQDMTSSNGDFKITWNASGILTVTPS